MNSRLIKLDLKRNFYPDLFIKSTIFKLFKGVLSTDIVLQKNDANAMDVACEQQGSFKENGKKKDAYTLNQLKFQGRKERWLGE